jgi:16S rRNA (cytidine1402-2'-O)-methyltransferase
MPDVYPGTLYIIPTPIGNLGDLTTRSLEILRQVDRVAAEDTRTARKLFSHFGIDTPLVSFHEYSTTGRVTSLVRQLKDGLSLGLVSEAGTPGISDPGFALVRAAIDAGIPLVSLPGPCAAVTALVASGLPMNEYYFVGFLPARKNAREQRLADLARVPATMIMYESPRRIVSTLAAVAKILGNRQICIARELTKIHEEYLRGPVEDILAREGDRRWRGEITLLVAGWSKNDQREAVAGAEELKQRLRELRQGGETSTRNLVDILQGEFPGWRKKDIYRLVLEVGRQPLPTGGDER